MSMKLLDGKKIAENRLSDLMDQVEKLDQQLALAVVLVGDEPASHLYVKLKEKKGKRGWY